MKILFALVVWFGSGSTQSSFAVSGISSYQECQRLGAVLAKGKSYAEVDCQPYKAG